MDTKRIRQLNVETVVNSDSDTTKLITMVYCVGNKRRIPLKSGDVDMVISDIVACKKHYKLYIADGAVSKEWKNIPKSKRVTVDFFID